MSDGLPWIRVLIMMGLLTAMFGFPIVSLTLDGRRARRTAGPTDGASAEPVDVDDSARGAG